MNYIRSMSHFMSGFVGAFCVFNAVYNRLLVAFLFCALSFCIFVLGDILERSAKSEETK
jgi:hypothetical protein